MESLKYILSIISGGILLEVFKLLYPDIKNIFNRKIEAKKIFNKHSDTILKSADELFGKIYSLAKEDFQLFTKYNKDKDEINKIYVLYLFASFWASLSILKKESSYFHLARIKKGERLLCFVTSYESKKNRILDRSYQRAIGESVVQKDNSNYQIMSLFEFTNEYNNEDSNIRKVITPLEKSLFLTGDKTHRQKILLFGIIIQSLIDFLDRKHTVVRNREPYINKLSLKTKGELKNRIFNHYLTFVKNASIYYKKRPPAKYDLQLLAKSLFGRVRIFNR